MLLSPPLQVQGEHENIKKIFFTKKKKFATPLCQFHLGVLCRKELHGQKEKNNHVTTLSDHKSDERKL